MPNYETVFIARQDISATQVEGLVENFEKVITDAGGSVPKKESWGLKTLSYKIKKNRKGHYMLLNIAAEAEAKAEARGIWAGEFIRPERWRRGDRLPGCE